MRIAIAGLHAETNTFLPVPAELRRGVLRGQDIVAEFAGSLATIAGFLRVCREEGAEVVPLVYANAWACGAIPVDEFESVVDEILQGLADDGPFDVVLLAQHGAAVSDDHLDADGELVARVRSVVGPDATVAIGLDLHGNISKRVIDSVDVAVGYRENPHRDPAIRGAECARLALKCARGEARPAQRLVRLPMVVPILGGWTGGGAMCDVMSDAGRIAADYSLLSYTVFHGFGYADVPHMGSSVLAIADGNGEIAQRAARAIADGLWERREELRGESLACSAALDEAERRSTRTGPLVLLDVGDNIGGGAPGDSTVLLAEARRRELPGFVTTLCDERAVHQALTAGSGAELEVLVGRTTPVSVGPQLSIRGRVARITDGRFEDRNPTHGGFRFYDGGPTIRLTMAHEQELVISSRPVPPFSLEQLRAVGIEPRERPVIVAKGVVAPRAGYEVVTSDFLLVDTPGVTAADLSQFAYRRRPDPLWPLESGARESNADGTDRNVG